MNTLITENQKKKKQKIKNVTKIIKVEIPAGGAAITPPLGPVLGQYGMNTMEFCKDFNEESKLFDKETIIPTLIYLASDKNFYFELNTPGVAYFIKKFIESNEIEKDKINNLYFIDKKSFLRFLYDVALFKLTFATDIKKVSNTLDSSFIKNYIRSMLGTARSFGIRFQ